MKWVLKNPAPSDSRRTKWGDYHFGRSLTKYLERSGDEVVTQYDPGWSDDLPADVVLVLRGKYAFPPDVSHGGALRVMWNISHPSDVTLEEYETYDLVFVASRGWAQRLRAQITRPVFPLLQCTDLEEFDLDATERRDIVFIGNTRDVERPGVLWALDYGIPLKIWGRGWEKAGVPSDRVVGDYFPNEELGQLYSGSVATLNDHWHDMREYGFISNRILDSLASGTPVVSDWHEELSGALPEGGVLFYRDRDEFDDCMQSLLLTYPAIRERAEQARRVVREEFGFKQRVRQMRQLVDMAVRARSVDSPSVSLSEENLRARAVQGGAGGDGARFCPVCQSDLSKFEPFRTRSAAKCPECGALERHRLLWLYLIQRTNLLDDEKKTLLHVAPERYLAGLLWNVPGLDYVSADLDSDVAMERLDLTDAHYPDGTFDAILCNHVLEHIPDDQRAMRELCRLLKPGGWAILQVPMTTTGNTDEDPSVTDPEERQRRWGQSDHVRLYGSEDYAARLTDNGFEVTVDAFARELDPAVVQLCGIKKQDIFLCRRPV